MLICDFRFFLFVSIITHRLHVEAFDNFAINIKLRAANTFAGSHILRKIIESIQFHGTGIDCPVFDKVIGRVLTVAALHPLAVFLLHSLRLNDGITGCGEDCVEFFLGAVGTGMSLLYCLLKGYLTVNIMKPQGFDCHPRLLFIGRIYTSPFLPLLPQLLGSEPFIDFLRGNL